MLRQIITGLLLSLLACARLQAQAPFLLDRWAQAAYDEENYLAAVKYAVFSLKRWEKGKNSRRMIKNGFASRTTQSSDSIRALERQAESFRGDATVRALLHERAICEKDMDLSEFIERELNAYPELATDVHEIMEVLEVPNYARIYQKANRLLPQMRQRAAQMHYDRALMLMQPRQVEDHRLYNPMDSNRLATKELERCLHFDPHFEDARALMAEARQAGTKRIAVLPFNFFDPADYQLSRLLGSQMARVMAQTDQPFVEVLPFNQVERQAREVDYNGTVSVDDPSSVASLAQQLEVDEIWFGELIALDPGEITKSKPAERSGFYFIPDTLKIRTDDGKIERDVDHKRVSYRYYETTTNVTSTASVRFRRYDARTGEPSPLLERDVTGEFESVKVIRPQITKRPRKIENRYVRRDFKKYWLEELDELMIDHQTPPLPEAKSRFTALVERFANEQAHQLPQLEGTSHLSIITRIDQLPGR
jgi:hypothetical protein